jgi:hypothetical protein
MYSEPTALEEDHGATIDQDTRNTMSFKNRIARTISVAALAILFALPLGIRANGEGVSGTGRPPMPPASAIVLVTSTYTQYSDGTLVFTDGTMITPNGTTYCPNGTVITPDGTIYYPDGSILYTNGVFVPAPVAPAGP